MHKNDTYWPLSDAMGPELIKIVGLIERMEDLTKERGLVCATFNLWHASLKVDMNRIMRKLVPWKETDPHFQEHIKPLGMSLFFSQSAAGNPLWEKLGSSTLYLAFPSEWKSEVKPLANMPGCDPVLRREPESRLNLPDYFAKVIIPTVVRVQRALQQLKASHDTEINFRTTIASVRRVND